MFLVNAEIKSLKGRIPYWKIADKLGIHEQTLVRWMRKELSVKTKEEIKKAIKEIKKER